MTVRVVVGWFDGEYVPVQAVVQSGGEVTIWSRMIDGVTKTSMKGTLDDVTGGLSKEIEDVELEDEAAISALLSIPTT